MKLNYKKLKLLSIITALILIFSGCTLNSSKQVFDSSKLIVHYIDVGQGDSILVQVNGKNMLIDAGTNESSKKLIGYIDSLGIKALDIVVETHPHEDHIGGMSKVISKYNIGKFYAPKITSNSRTFKDMITSLKKKNLVIHVPKPGDNFDLGNETSCTVLAPNSSSYADVNNYSIVLKLVYGNSKFLFMGDAQKLSEDEILKQNIDLKCDVLKIGHHGSRSSTSDEFLAAAKPKIAVISCGKGNDYGHPHKPTLEKLKKINDVIYRTDLNGTIVLESDGTSIKKAP